MRFVTVPRPVAPAHRSAYGWPMGDREEPDFELHIRSDGRSIEEIAQRLREMQRELDERAPVHPHSDDASPRVG